VQSAEGSHSSFYNSAKTEWLDQNHVKIKKFQESDSIAVFTTKFVLNDGKDITIVYHDKEDGAWQFFSKDHFDHLKMLPK
jgi:hypothetical protein